MMEQIGQVFVKPADISGSGTSSVHEIQRPLGIIFPGQGPVHRFHCLRGHHAGIQPSVTYGRELGCLVDHICDGIGELAAAHPVQYYIGYQNPPFRIADSRLGLYDPL